MTKKERISHGLNVVKKLWRHKYFWATAFFVVVAGFLDQNSFLQRYRLNRQANQLKEEIARYRAAYESETSQLRDLQRHPEAIERIARERYFMKRADEDIYLIDNAPVEPHPASPATDRP